MIIFTTITNAYDTIPDHHYDPDVKYVLFYDKPIEQRGPWEFIKISEEGDPVLKAYRIRCLSHLWFDEPHVWVDACYRMDETFADRSRDILQNEITLQRHPQPRTLLGEFIKLHRYGFVPPERLYRCAEDIMSVGYKPTMWDHTINSCIWRHNTPAVVDWNVEYWRWYKNYKLYHGCQITSAIAEHLVFGKNVPRVSIQFDMGRSTRSKVYSSSYTLDENTDETVSGKLADIFGTSIRIERTSENSPLVTLDTIKDSVDDLIVYSCITDGYDEICADNEYDPDVTYVMFHDGTVDIPEPWIAMDVRQFCDVDCPRLLSFFPKANPHLFFPDKSNTVWVDGCYKLTLEFVEQAKKMFPHTLVRHPMNFNFYDEMIEGYENDYFSYKDGINMCSHIKNLGYKPGSYRRIQSVVVYRRMSERMTKFNELWWQYGNIGNPRDNIAHDVALKLSGLNPEFIEDLQKTCLQLGRDYKYGRLKTHPTVEHNERGVENFYTDIKNIFL